MNDRSDTGAGHTGVSQGWKWSEDQRIEDLADWIWESEFTYGRGTPQEWQELFQFMLDHGPTGPIDGLEDGVALEEVTRALAVIQDKLPVREWEDRLR